MQQLRQMVRSAYFPTLAEIWLIIKLISILIPVTNNNGHAVTRKSLAVNPTCAALAAKATRVHQENGRRRAIKSKQIKKKPTAQMQCVPLPSNNTSPELHNIITATTKGVSLVDHGKEPPD